LQDEIKGMVGKGQVASIRIGKLSGWKDVTGMLQTIQKQIHTEEMIRRCTKSNILSQYTTPTATHFENPQVRKSGQPLLAQGIQNRTLPPVDGKEVGAIEQRVDIATGKPALAIYIFIAQTGNISWLFHG